MLEKLPDLGDEDVKHNWLYSVVPSYDPDMPGIYLAGYCKLDNKYFTVRLHQDGLSNFVVLGNVGIPKWGCEPID